jgi:hypothetical protein
VDVEDWLALAGDQLEAALAYRGHRGDRERALATDEPLAVKLPHRAGAVGQQAIDRAAVGIGLGAVDRQVDGAAGQLAAPQPARLGPAFGLQAEPRGAKAAGPDQDLLARDRHGLGAGRDVGRDRPEPERRAGQALGVGRRGDRDQRHAAAR